MRKVSQLLNQGYDYFGSGGVNSEEFINFYELFCNSFHRELKRIGAFDFVFSKNHFSLNGFFKLKEQVYYFSLSDVRTQYGRPEDLLIRTAKNYRDFTGGANKYVKVGIGMYRQVGMVCGMTMSELTSIDLLKKPKKTPKYYADKILKKSETYKGTITYSMSSMRMANSVMWKLSDLLNLKSESINVSKSGRSIIMAYHTNETFRYNYSPDIKQMSIVFSDEYYKQ